MNTTPQSKEELLQKAKLLAGMSLAELAEQYQLEIPIQLLHAKGLIGQLLERALGATAGNQSKPDFEKLGIELKTIPINKSFQPCETTYVCVVPLRNTSGLQWQDSCVYKKLAQVLWIPIEADPEIAIGERRIGMPLLWLLSNDDEKIIRQDWEEHMELISLGNVAEIDAHKGIYLQIRPKAKDSSAKRKGIDEEGNVIDTLPRGFYLRTCFTAKILASNYVGYN